jgi:hypothetical protein
MVAKNGRSSASVGIPGPGLFNPARPARPRLSGIALVVLISAALALWSVMRRSAAGVFDKTVPPERANEVRAKVFLVAWLHFIAVLAQVAWLWVLPQGYDVIFMALNLARLASYRWTECVLNYTEKKLIDPSYVARSQPYVDPYVDGLPGYMQWLYIVTLLFVLPYVMYVVFATSPYFGRYAWLVAVLVTAWAWHAWINFAMQKVPGLLLT